MTKLLDRFDVLSDAIMAIIMTILVLEISAPSQAAELVPFFKEVSLFLVSFMLLINIWYRRTKIVLRTKITKLECLLLDVFAHALMALFPLAIKMLVSYEEEWVAVFFFGLLNLFVMTAITLIPLVEQGTAWEKGTVSGWTHVFFRKRVIWTIVLNVMIILVAYCLGGYGTYVYLLMPFADFFASYQRDRRLKEALERDDLRSILAEKLGIER